MTLNQPRLLWGVIVGLAAILALEWLWPAGHGSEPGVPPVRVSTHVPGTPVTARDTSGWGATILQRPVFSISRRPPHVVRGGGPTTAPGQARLAGIMISRHGRRAIFAPDGGGKQMVLAEGAAVNDSTIRQIKADRVILASGTVLLPAYDKNRSTATTPPFQPVQTNFPGFTPGFPNPGFPNPAFPNPTFPGQNNPAFAPQGISPPPQPNGEDGVPFQAVPPSPRNPIIPQRRE